jgi:hypothetical protein
MSAKPDRLRSCASIRLTSSKNSAQSADDIAHREIRRALTRLRVLHHIVGGQTVAPQSVVKPSCQRRFRRIKAAQAFGDLCGGDFGKFASVPFGDRNVERHCGRRSGPHDLVHDVVGPLAKRLAVNNLLGKPPHVFDKYDAQGNGDRPYLADLKGLNLLIGADKPHQYVLRKQTVGMRNVSPCDGEDPGVACERTILEFRKLPVVAGREVGADLLQVLLHQMVVVEQPLCGRCDQAAPMDSLRAGPVCREKHLPVIT